MLVFIDDSGDPGFKIRKGSSKIFVISLIIFRDNLEAEKASLAIKQLRRTLKMSDFAEFKFNKSSRKVKNAFIDSVKPFNFKIRAIVVNKNIIHSAQLKTHKENFYNYMIMQVIKKSQSIKKAKLKFDKRGEKEIRNQLRVYLSRELNNRERNIFIDLKFVDSRQNTLIQLADMVAGSIFSFYTNKDKTYLKKLKTASKVEDVWIFQ